MKLEELKGKYAFISHPYAGNPTQNKIKVDKICKYWAKKGIIPISPLHMFSFYEDDSNREKILNICYRLIDIVDVVFIYGDSEGCRLEKEYAKKKKKPIFIFYDEYEINFHNCKKLMEEKSGVPLVLRKSFFRTDYRNRKATQIEQIFINTNGFLNFGGYGEEKGFAPTSTKYPKIILNGIEREVKAMI